MTNKESVRINIADAIDSVLIMKDTELKLKALVGIKKVVDELQYDLSLLIGEQTALIEINKLQKKER
jgi:hypothetical protein